MDALVSSLVSFPPSQPPSEAEYDKLVKALLKQLNGTTITPSKLRAGISGNTLLEVDCSRPFLWSVR